MKYVDKQISGVLTNPTVKKGDGESVCCWGIVKRCALMNSSRCRSFTHDLFTAASC